ncbi:hypothetical protein P8452_54297 [Trifolium repens]|nr:hypothetical protein P8452_54297 [Trifolium repens]
MDDVSSEVSDKLSDNVLFSNPESCSNFQGSTSLNTITELSKNTTKTCTHTHTCIPPGPDDLSSFELVIFISSSLRTFRYSLNPSYS